MRAPKNTSLWPSNIMLACCAEKDMSEGCGAHGKLMGVNIVKPHHAQVGVFPVETQVTWENWLNWKKNHEVFCTK